jgi:lipopolysaccharide transport system ATP-binding protein
MGEIAIKFEQVSKKYRLRPRTLREGLTHLARTIRASLDRGGEARSSEFWALKGISFEVKKGESIGIIGPNGAGKSTILKLIAGITAPTEGRVFTKGRIAPLIELGAGFHPELTGRENIFLNGSILGMSRREIKQKMDSIIAFADLEEFIDTPIKRYSSGMYVRLGFSVAAHLDPEILLVDEVLAVGDTGFRVRCMERIRELISSGVTVCYITHNILSIRGLCNQAFFLEKGAVQAMGSPDFVIESYNRYLSGKPTYNFVTKEVGDRPKETLIHSVEILDESGVPRKNLSRGRVSE